MRKIALIISREYLSRIKKKSFIIMTILGPVLFAAMMVLPTYFANMEDKDVKTIAVIDSSKLFKDKIPNSEYLKFVYLENISLETLKKNFDNSGFYGILYITHMVGFSQPQVHIYSKKQPTMAIKMYIQSVLEKEIEKQKLYASGINDNILNAIKTNIKVIIIKLEDGGVEKRTNTGLIMAVGYICGFLIYFFIFLFGSQVMRGVMEEKGNRIVEVIISSVKPFQLMMGKIIGVGLVALTQFALWILLTFVFLNIFQTSLMPQHKVASSDQIVSQDLFTSKPLNQPIAETSDSNKITSELTESFSYLKYINFGVLIFSFLFYFIGGYLLYGSLFAIVGAVSDHDTDTQQFMLPITVPLILAIFVMVGAMQNPESSVAFWFSIIPFTSPIVMMVRIPFGVPYWQIYLSMALLVITFIGTVWMSAQIYRTGILMYGKKITYREVWKWLKYKS